jgi:dolichyl-phosphate beta-glucosyltransferase
MKLSIVVPAYNEAQRILPSLEHAFAYLEARALSCEVLIVDDGSTDDTAALVRQRFGDRPQLRLLSYGGNRGKGYAVRFGGAQACGDIVLFSDADFSTPIEEFDKMLPLLEQGYDMVIGSRALKGAEIRERQPFYREGAGKLFNLLVRLLVAPEFHDTQCGFKCYRREPMLPVLERQRIDGFAFDVEMIALARAAGLRIAEVPVVWVNSPTSKVGLAGGLAAFLDLFGIWRRAHKIGAAHADGGNRAQVPPPAH